MSDNEKLKINLQLFATANPSVPGDGESEEDDVTGGGTTEGGNSGNTGENEGGSTGSETPGGNEGTNPDDGDDYEELPMEDKKKAINLQDLVYVKKYIDDNHYDMEETDNMIKEVADEHKTMINQLFTNYANTMDTVIDTKMNANLNPIRTTLTNITDGTTAVGDSKKVNGVEIKQDSNSVLKVGDDVITRKRLLWTCEGANVTSASVSLQNDDIIEIVCSEGTVRRKVSIGSAKIEHIKIYGDIVYFQCVTLDVDSTGVKALYNIVKAINTKGTTISDTVVTTPFEVGDSAIGEVYIREIYKIIE